MAFLQSRPWAWVASVFPPRAAYPTHLPKSQLSLVCNAVLRQTKYQKITAAGGRQLGKTEKHPLADAVSFQTNLESDSILQNRKRKSLPADISSQQAQKSGAGLIPIQTNVAHKEADKRHPNCHSLMSIIKSLCPDHHRQSPSIRLLGQAHTGNQLFKLIGCLRITSFMHQSKRHHARLKHIYRDTY